MIKELRHKEKENKWSKSMFKKTGSQTEQKEHNVNKKEIENDTDFWI